MSNPHVHKCDRHSYFAGQAQMSGSKAETVEPQRREAEAPAGSPRRAPAQQRSRDRMERILAVASGLLAEKGSELLRMSEVAGLAGISIGSLYQYFPDKSAIIRTLAERYSQASRRCIEAALAEVGDLDGLRAAFSRLVDQYHAIM